MEVWASSTGICPKPLAHCSPLWQRFPNLMDSTSPKALKPPSGKGARVSKSTMVCFFRAIMTFIISSADPSGSLVICPSLGSRWSLGTMVASPVFLSGMCGVQGIETTSCCTASFRGGILSLILSKPFASSKLQILCGGENPRIALCKVYHPSANTPLGNIPVRVRPLSVSTLSLSSLRTEKTLAILPIARCFL